MTERPRPPRARIPAHVGVIFGASTAAYAILLAGVAGAQSQAEAAARDAVQPAMAGLAELTKGHDALADDVGRAGADYDAAASAYRATGSDLASLEDRLAALAASVARIDGVSRTLPSGAALPTIRSISSASVPAHVTTGASTVVP